jgi:hypothetical protein
LSVSFGSWYNATPRQGSLEAVGADNDSVAL